MVCAKHTETVKHTGCLSNHRGEVWWVSKSRMALWSAAARIYQVCCISTQKAVSSLYCWQPRGCEPYCMSSNTHNYCNSVILPSVRPAVPFMMISSSVPMNSGWNTSRQSRWQAQVERPFPIQVIKKETLLEPVRFWVSGGDPSLPCIKSAGHLYLY